MSEKTKKILTIIGFILFVLLMAFALYWFLFRPLFAPPATTITANLNVIGGGGLPTTIPAVNRSILPEILNKIAGLPPENPVAPLPTTPTTLGPTVSPTASGGITSLSTLEANPSQDLTLANNGQDLIYYSPETGAFYKIDPNGQKTLFSETTFKNVQKVTWSPNNQNAVLEYPDGSNIIYDFKKKTSVTLPKQWEQFIFATDSQKIAFKDMRLDPENRFIAASDLNGSNYQPIEQIGDQTADIHVTWSPNDKYVALYNKSVDGDRADVYPIGFNQENFQTFKVEGRDFRFDWAPDGNKLLYSVYNSRSDYNPSLWVVNTSPDLLATGRNKLEIQTWADKCTFSDTNTIYCAVPRTLETGTGFRPDMADKTPDDIYKINLRTGAQELIAQPLFPTTVNKMFVSQDAKYLYWLEKNTGQIKKLDL